MKFETKYGIGETIAFHPFGKTELKTKAIIKRIIINGSADGFNVEYIATDAKDVDWCLHEKNVIEE